MKSKILAVAALVATAAVPLATFAATYNYVNVSGNISAVDASDASQALTVSDIAASSGVILDNGTVNMSGFIPVSGYGTASVSTGSFTAVTNNPAMHTYEYVDMNGNVSYVQAANADDARALAGSNVSSSSGFLLVQ